MTPADDLELGETVVESPLSQEDLDKSPQKYIGYKGFATCLASDDDFFILRRFDYLHCRMLLRLQDQVVEVEEGLNNIDSRFSNKASPEVDNGSFRNDQNERKALLDEIHDRLSRYDTMLCQYIQLKARPQPPRNNMRNLRTWLGNRNGPINTQELGFIDAHDLITAAKFEKSNIRRLFEQFILAPTSGLFGLLSRTAPGEEAYTASTTIMGEDEHVDAIAAGAIFIVALMMLIAPLWILAVLEDIFRKLAVITVFTLFLLLVLTWGTLARPFEILAAAAGWKLKFVEDGRNYDLTASSILSKI